MHRDFSTLAIIDKPYESCARAWRVTAARLIIDRNRQNTTSMPEIARFYGIIIRMFMEPLVQHNRPHFHAYYQGFVAVIGIDEVELVAGEILKSNYV